MFVFVICPCFDISALRPEKKDDRAKNKENSEKVKLGMKTDAMLSCGLGTLSLPAPTIMGRRRVEGVLGP